MQQISLGSGTKQDVQDCFVQELGVCLENHVQVDQPEVFALPAAKRRRCNELRQEGGYQLEANAGSVAPNPKAFKVHPLREEQLRSLAWMYSREACRDGFKGGMLADKMGYGKTATTIGMLSEKPGQVPDERPSGYIRTGGRYATLYTRNMFKHHSIADCCE